MFQTLFKPLFNTIIALLKIILTLIVVLIISALVFKEPFLNSMKHYVALSDPSQKNTSFIITPDSKNYQDLGATKDITTSGCLVRKSKTDPFNKKELKIAVWNIYKLQNSHWHLSLQQLMQENDFILLQENKMTHALTTLVRSQGWHIYQTNAFTLNDLSLGVALLSKTSADKVCGYLTSEPWIRFPKSAMIAYFSLTNGQQLTIANIHSLNFSIGLTDYQAQLNQLIAPLLQKSAGPIIFAGDFNTWREKRTQLIQTNLKKLNLQEVSFNNDQRITWLSNPLDHIFYQGLEIKQANVIVNDSSDHMAMTIDATIK